MSDEELTTPYVEPWEEYDGIDSLTTSLDGDKARVQEETIRTITDGEGSMGPFCGDVRTSTAVRPGQQATEEVVLPGNGRQWDVHWSYTKWAVETMRFAKKLAPWQRVNHFRNSNELCRKVRLSI